MAVSAFKAKSGIYTYPPTFYPTAFLLYQNFVSALNPVNYFGIHWVNVFVNSYTFATLGALIALGLGYRWPSRSPTSTSRASTSWRSTSSA